MYIWTCSKPYTMYTTTANVYSFEKSQLNGRRSGVEKMFGWFWNHAFSSSAVNQDLLTCGTFSWIRDYLFQVRIRKKWQINNQNFMSFCLKKRDTSWLILLFQNSKKHVLNQSDQMQIWIRNVAGSGINYSGFTTLLYVQTNFKHGETVFFNNRSFTLHSRGFTGAS